nr:Retrovirus-related Pol polyprotein from transposon RE1 [Ipomoea batatas]
MLDEKVVRGDVVLGSADSRRGRGLGVGELLGTKLFVNMHWETFDVAWCVLLASGDCWLRAKGEWLGTKRFVYMHGEMFNQVSQFMQDTRHLHLVVVRRIVRYLQGTPTRGLFFSVDSPIYLVTYSDAD